MQHKLDHYYSMDKTFGGTYWVGEQHKSTSFDPGPLLYDICTWLHAAFFALLSDWLKMTRDTSLAPQDALPLLTGPLETEAPLPTVQLMAPPLTHIAIPNMTARLMTTLPDSRVHTRTHRRTHTQTQMLQECMQNHIQTHFLYLT